MQAKRDQINQPHLGTYTKNDRGEGGGGVIQFLISKTLCPWSESVPLGISCLFASLMSFLICIRDFIDDDFPPELFLRPPPSTYRYYLWCTFPQEFSQAVTSQGYFPKWQLPKGIFSSGIFPRVFSQMATSKMCNFPCGNFQSLS